MDSELLNSIETIQREKGIEKTTLIEALRTALLSACKKTFPNCETMDIQIDADTLKIKLLQNGEEVPHADFGRIAAQTAKQVIIQKLREAERDSVYEEFAKKEGEIISGAVHTVDPKMIVVDLGKAEAILPAREQFSNDSYRQGDTIRAYLLRVKKTPKGPEIILSRTHPNLVRKLFELEVPEVSDKIVEIVEVAREPGSRTKIAVISHNNKIDAVGSCVGVRGYRVKNIVNELEGEKIDIVPWSDDPETFIRESLKPAKLAEVKLFATESRAEILVEDDQLSLAIGKKGQNVRLASKLTGWKLDIYSLSLRQPVSHLEGVGKKTKEALSNAGYNTLKDLGKASLEDLIKVPGIGPKTAEKILRARGVLRETEGSSPQEKSPHSEKEGGSSQGEQTPGGKL